jgi:CBS domain-containing protein
VTQPKTPVGQSPAVDIVRIRADDNRGVAALALADHGLLVVSVVDNYDRLQGIIPGDEERLAVSPRQATDRPRQTSRRGSVGARRQSCRFTMQCTASSSAP